MYSVLFICYGNVGRSQMAEAFYNHYKGVNNDVAISAGIQDVAAKYGGHPSAEIIQVMAEKGMDVSGQLIKQVTIEMLAQVERVVILCQKEQCFTFLLDETHPNVSFYHIEDPYQSSIEETRRIRDEIEQLVLNL